MSAELPDSVPRLALLLEQAPPDSARDLLAALALPTVNHAAPEQFDYLLHYSQQGWSLQQLGKSPPGPVQVNFASNASSYRRLKGGGELIVKAVAGNKQCLPTVLDLTAGLGGDSFILASRGYPVTMLERSPIAALLLGDGLQRAASSDDEDLRAIIQRMNLVHGDSLVYLGDLPESRWPDVIYIDPMFPHSRKSAQVKKAMQAFQQLVGIDSDSDALLPMAMRRARHRVVVKRPLKAPCLAGLEPSHSHKGKAIRYDVYGIKAFAKA